jgi:shikimate dehydrogenase
MTLKAGIVGWPVTHSLSPVLHGYWLKEHGIDGEMLRVPAPPEEFSNVIARLRAEGFQGVNVTVPHKEAAFALAQKRDPAALEAGAVNLLVFRDGGIEGRNTDIFGLVESLRAAVPLAGKSVVLLGAGGAARGAVLALSQLGAFTIHILNRSADRAAALAAGLQPGVKSRLVPGPLSDWKNVAGDAALLLNSTSAGMTGNPPLDLDLSILNKRAAVCDIVYNPLQTQLLKDAAARGHGTIDGLGMLMHQAVPSFEAFFGVRPQVTPGLRAELERVLRERQG